MGLTPDELDDLARAPKRTRTDEGAVTERDAKDLIAMDGYSKSKNNKKPFFGLRIAQTKPPASAI